MTFHAARPVLRALALSSLLAAACSGPVQDIEVQCIQPPISRVSTDNDKIIGLAAELEQLPVDGGLELLFDSKVDLEFARIVDCEAGLHLFLNAIDCYMQRGAVGEEIARAMAQTVQNTWFECHGWTEGPKATDAEVTAYYDMKMAGYPDETGLDQRLAEFGLKNRER